MKGFGAKDLKPSEEVAEKNEKRERKNFGGSGIHGESAKKSPGSSSRIGWGSRKRAALSGKKLPMLQRFFGLRPQPK
ncbi:hypothetical protein SUTMEG_05950 [Sutterella megalosphaeroides]|uniref:Uncharacterized protein n=1 Tax=Sutterella megalosphaeroides TaxID=2494234 RepID=A0A2Z6I8I8_9BURK|nr:hypothetical protein SUTMEG_05950 [Sutterella megalosphaeroides]